MNPEIEAVIEELEKYEDEWRGHAAGEKLSGNVVKESLHQGTATGLKIAINLLKDKFYK